MEIRVRVVVAIILGGLVAGALDIISAFATLVPRGRTEIDILHFIASGLIGRTAISGGAATALLGLAVHFGLTAIMATAFVLTSLRFEVLRRAPWISGIVYGVLLYAIMNYVAVPLSAVAAWKPGGGWSIIGGILGHITYVGLPIALLARHFIAPTTNPP
jgi:uncharacterized membrane protein YagU involved in acid resistance